MKLFNLLKKETKHPITITEEKLVNCLNSLNSLSDRKVHQVTDLVKTDNNKWEFSMVYALNGATDFLIDLKCSISETIYENFINSKTKVQKLDSRSLSYIIGGGDGDPATDPDAVTPIRGKNVKLGRSPGGDIL